MTAIHLMGLLAAILYLAASATAWQQLKTEPAKATHFLALSLLAVALHAMYLWQLLVSPEGITLGFFPMASLIAGSGALIATLASLYRPLEWVSALMFPLSGVLILPLLFSPAPSGQLMQHGVGSHVLLSILAVAVLALTSAQALVLLFQHRQLKRGHFTKVIGSFPAIQITERMLFELLWAGFIVLSGTIITGFVFLDDLLAQHVAHKTILTIVAWVLLAMLLAGRYLFGWRALTAVRFTLISFVILVLAFFGSQFVFEFVLA